MNSESGKLYPDFFLNSHGVTVCHELSQSWSPWDINVFFYKQH